MTPAKRQNFERLLAPRHIAFLGGADAAVAIGEARRAGFSGQIWAVNPKRTEIAGYPCFKDLADLPEAPDAVFLAIPAAHAPPAVAALRKLGAGGIVCYSAGFGEAHEAGAQLETALKAELGEMVLIGPNCYGLINYIGKSALWPFAHGGRCPGYGAAVITQSGMFSSDITMSQRSLPLAYMVSTGNQADLGLTEFINLFCDRPEVRAIGLHIEGLVDIPAFERAALKAVQAGTPIVALKTGKSAIGERLTLSHTGSLAGAKELYEALFDRVGIINVTNPSQFLETLKYLCIAGVPEGHDVVGFTASGGGATMLADHAEEIGLSFVPPRVAACARLTELLPPIATVSNPLDYTTPIWGQPEKTEPVFREAMRIVPAQSTVLVQDYPAKGLDETEPLYLNDGLAFARAARAANLPAAICATIPENMPTHIRETFVAEGVAPMQGIHETLNAMRDSAWWYGKRQQTRDDPPAPLLAVPDVSKSTMIIEAKAKRHLASAGVPVPRGVQITATDLPALSHDLTYPVALKMMSHKIAHKTEAGAVALNIESADQLTAAMTQMHQRVTRYDADAVTDLFLVEQLAPKPLAELVVGLRHDPQFGLCMTLGSGGVFVDMLQDTISLLLPASPREIENALRRLKAWTLLDGYRGAPRADPAPVIDTVLMLSRYMIENADEITEIEINPLFVYENNVLAVDALMQVCKR